jgi:hypothetical protein
VKRQVITMTARHASEAVEILINTRSAKETKSSDLVKIFKGQQPYTADFQYPLLEFFCEVPIPLMKRYMNEAEISKQEVIDVFKQLPDLAQKYDFQEALTSGKF